MKKFLFFIFLLVLIFGLYHNVLNSYFESDEWFYFSYYLPLTSKSFGLITSITSMFTNSSYISGGQHIVPIAAIIYFFNAKFFGLNFMPYAFMALILHSINSYLVFVLIDILLKRIKKTHPFYNFYPFIGSIFFAISPIPMHAITGFAFFYGQNVLSVTFFLLTIISYELAFIKGSKKYILLTTLFLLLALLTQETTSYLFLVLPIITLYKNKKFSHKYLFTIYLSCLVIYVILRFLIPNAHNIYQYVVGQYFDASRYGQEYHVNLQSTPNEIIFRSLTFPIRMVGSVYIPKESNELVMHIIAPIISPYPSGGDPAIQLAFLNYSGQSMLIYLIGLIIIFACIAKTIKFVSKKKYNEANYLASGLSILMLGALPLVALLFVFPSWGYDIYFDSRYYYLPGIGAAILFPFVIFSLAKQISKKLDSKYYFISVIALFCIWFFNNMYIFEKSIKVYTRNYTIERENVVAQITHYLPSLKTKTIFYVEVDGKSPFVSLPFFTSVPQALSVVYFHRNGLPDSFYNKPLFKRKPEGYQYENGRGFGFFISKKELLKAIKDNQFSVYDVYGFYYYGKDSKIKNITTNIRRAIEEDMRNNTISDILQ